MDQTQTCGRGEPFIIAKAGKAVAKVIALGAPSGDQIRRLGENSFSRTTYVQHRSSL
jgi:antitoxin (DNA-binding transcriptional repressor) of toxin-antitoxin stability system